MKWGLVACASLALGGVASVAQAAPVTSITQYGITWTFDKAYESGQFVSGDYWVVGPVTVVSVTPAPTGTRNGSAVNPMGGRQAYDDRGGQYDTQDAATFPLTLAIDSSLVSSISKPDGAEIKNVGCMDDQAVLTAVAAPQPASMLRPAYAGTYKRYLDSANIDWSLLPNLPAPASKPNGTDLLRMADRPRMDHLSSWTIQNSCAEHNWFNGNGAHACYGREVAAFVNAAAQYVMLDTPERDELAISMIQHGIDNYGVVKAGGSWLGNGGHHSGRKWPVVFAARLLNECEMLKVGADYDDRTFGEDSQTYFGAGGTALFGWDCGGGQGSYFQDGCSGGGAKDCRDPAGMVDGCPDYRNCCTSAYWVGEMLATLMTNSKAVWNHDAFFDYVDRWMAGDVSGGGDASSAFIEDMWSQYRNNLPPAPAPDPSCVPGSGGAGGASGDAGGGSSGSAGAAAGGTSAGGSSSGTSGATPESSDDSSGCGCRTAPAPASLVWLAALALALGLARRRGSA